MSNIFSGGSHDLDLSNGATAVFIDVLMPAVSDLASEDCDFRFAALLTLQDQNVLGRMTSTVTARRGHRRSRAQS